MVEKGDGHFPTYNDIKEQDKISEEEEIKNTIVTNKKIQV